MPMNKKVAAKAKPKDLNDFLKEGKRPPSKTFIHSLPMVQTGMARLSARTTHHKD